MGDRWQRLRARLRGWRRFPHAWVYGEVESGAKIGEGAWIPYGVRVRADVEIGRYSYVMPATDLHGVTIGPFCSIAEDLRLLSHAHPHAHFSTFPFRTRLAMHGRRIDLPYEDRIFLGRITIGADVWIGARCAIKGGVTIGTGAIVGAHSVVTRDVPPYAIVAGAPARLIRYRFGERARARLLATRWWEWPLEDILRRVGELDAIARDHA